MGQHVVLMFGLNIRSQNRITEPEQRAALDTVAGDLALVRMVEDKGTYLVTSEHPAPRVADLALRALSSYRQDLKINGAAVLTPDTVSAGLAELARVLTQRYGTCFDPRDHGVTIDGEPWRAGLAVPVCPGEISMQRSVFDKLTNAIVLGWAHGSVLVVKRQAHNIHWGTTVTDPSERRLRRLDGVVVKLTSRSGDVLRRLSQGRRYMSRVALLILAIALSAVTGASAEVKRFEPFRQEVTALESAAACRGRVTPAGDGLGALYGCIKGRAETAKLFVNERFGTGQVENVKVMWNDWFQDRGHGIHADRGEAAQMLAGVLSRYAPRNKAKIVDAFFANAGMTFKEGVFTLTYRYRRGPAIDERLLIITQQ